MIKHYDQEIDSLTPGWTAIKWLLKYLHG